MEYTKPKYFNCQVVSGYKVYKKRKQYNLYKVLWLHSIPYYSKSQKYNIYAYRKKHCQYIFKKYYATYIIKKGKYTDYKNLLPKYTLDSEFQIIISFLFYLL